MTDRDDELALERMVRERLAAAVGGWTPNTTLLVRNGSALGRGIRRRRTVSGLAAALVVIVIAGLTYLGTSTSLLGFQRVSPAEGATVPATPQSLAALVVQHLPKSSYVENIAGSYGPSGPGPGTGQDLFGTQVSWSPDHDVRSEVLDSVSFYAWTRGVSAACSLFGRGSSCGQHFLANGATVILSRSAGPHDVQLFVLLPRCLVVVEESYDGSPADGSPPAASMRQRVEAIAADPSLGLTTSAALRDRGARLPRQSQIALGPISAADRKPVASSGPLVPATFRGLAAAVLQHLPAAATDVVHAAGGRSRDPQMGLNATFIFRLGGHLHQVAVSVMPISKQERPCCHMRTLPDGDLMGTHRLGGEFTVVVVRAGEMVAVVDGTGSGGSFRALATAHSLLEQIATDPMVGLKTSSQLNALGRRL